MKQLEVKNLSFSYDESTHAVRHVSLDVYKRQALLMAAVLAGLGVIFYLAAVWIFRRRDLSL